MRRTKTMLMGDLLEEFFKRPYVAAKVAEGKLPDTWREIVGDRAAEITTELKIENHILYARIQSSVLRSELFYQREALKEEINRRRNPPPLGRAAGQCRNYQVKHTAATPESAQEKGAGQSCTFFFSTSGEARSLAPDYWMIAARLAA